MITLNETQQLIYNYLILFAKENGYPTTIGYKELLTKLGLNYTMREFCDDLIIVSEKSYELDKIFLSAVVCSEKIPGIGFFVMASKKKLIGTHYISDRKKYLFWKVPWSFHRPKLF